MFLKPNLYYEIEHRKHHNFLALCCEHFGVVAFIKLNIENTLNILAFSSINFGVLALRNQPLEWACLQLYWFILDGGWSNWTDPGQCPESCDGGTSTR